MNTWTPNDALYMIHRWVRIPDKRHRMLRCMVDSLAQIPTKEAASCQKPRVVARNHRTWGFRMGPPIKLFAEKSVKGDAGNWNILVPAGKEINRDSLSKGDRRGNRTNRICPVKGRLLGPIEISSQPAEWNRDVGFGLGFCLTGRSEVRWKAAS